MTKFKCVYFVSDSGRVPVEVFVNELNARSRQKFFAVVGFLEEFGKQLPEPHAKYIGEDIYELRFQGIEGHIRVLYFFVIGDTIILTNGFVKKGWKIPGREKETAFERRKVYLEQHKTRG